MPMSPEEMQQMATMVATAFAQLQPTNGGGGRGSEGGSDFKKGLIKHLISYHGERELYNNWALKVFMNANAANEKIVEVLKYIEKGVEEIDDVKMNELEIKYTELEGYYVAKWSRELFEVLGIKLESEAFTILKSVESLSGFEVWRRLRQEAKPTTSAGTLRAIVGVVVCKRVDDVRNLMSKLTEWEV